MYRTNRRAIVLLKSFTVFDLPGNYAVSDVSRMQWRQRSTTEARLE